MMQTYEIIERWNNALKKKELIFIGGILVLALAMWAGISFVNKGSHGFIRITVDGEEYGTYSLAKNQTIKINDTNVCEIKDGQAHMISAECPDHLCMKQKAIDEKGGTIVCLPNKVVIEGEKSTKSDGTDEISIDAVT